jgi:hypothetical protein
LSSKLSTGSTHFKHPIQYQHEHTLAANGAGRDVTHRQFPLAEVLLLLLLLAAVYKPVIDLSEPS